MKAFDLIDSAGFGYRAVWQERRYLLKLAAVPVMIKLVCMVVVFAFGYETNFLRQALVTLPASFAEGWLLAQFLRTLLLLERWPIVLREEPSDKMMNALLTRARGIMSSTLTYALISYLGYGIKEVFASLYDAAGLASANPEQAATDANPLFFLPALLMIAVSLWVFRFLWLYIPVVVLMPIPLFLKKTGGFIQIIRMVGIFLVSVIPTYILAIFLSNIVAGSLGGISTDIGRFAIVVISVCTETLVGLVATASMAYSFRDIVPRHPLALPDVNEGRS